MWEQLKEMGGPLGSLMQVGSGLYTGITANDSGDVVDAVSGIAKGSMGLALAGGSQMAGPVGGVFNGLVEMGSGAYDMAQNAGQWDEGAFFADDGGRNEFWGGAGDATLGAAHTALNASAFLGPEVMPIVMALDKGLSLSEMAVNGVGFGAGLAGDALEAATGTEHDWKFDAGDVVGGVEHAMFSTAAGTVNAVAEGGMPTAMAAGAGGLLAGGAGMMATALTGGMAAPLIPFLAANGAALGATLQHRGIGGTMDAMTEWIG